MVKERVTDGETYYARSASANSIDVLHIERDCPALTAANSVREVARACYPDATLCARCAGAGSGGGADGPTLAGQLRAADSLEELREGWDA